MPEPEDILLADAVLAGDRSAQDELTHMLRGIVDEAARCVAPEDDHDDLAALVLYQILQAEERVLTAWDRAASLGHYLMAVSARVCCDEHHRFVVTRSPQSGEQPAGIDAHPSDGAVADGIARGEWQAAEAHAGSCQRCAQWILVAKRLAEPSEQFGHPSTGSR